MSLALGIDIGGTKMAYALVDTEGKIHAERTEPTDAQLGVESVLNRLAQHIHEILAGAPDAIDGIGIACPGPVDPARGMALNAVNLSWRNLPLVDGLRARGVQVNIALQNDVNALALGERTFGAARGVDDFVYLAIGTGLGAGAIASGCLINGATGSAMEVGHIVIDPDGPPCNCGKRGCVETFASGLGLAASMRAAGIPNPPPTGEILALARSGDPIARQAIDRAVSALGIAMAWCVTLLNPALFIIGGGLGKAAYDLLMPPAVDVMRVRVMPEAAAGLRFVPSQVASSALGAAAIVWQRT